LNNILAFPWTRGLKQTNKDAGSIIEFKTIVMSHKNVWNEIDINDETLTFDQDKNELKRSFPIAVSRHNIQNQQKIIVVGDSHFASDSAINNYSNKQFALNLVSWLTNSEISDEFSAERDSSINPSRLAHWVMNWFFCLLLPALLAAYWYLTRIYRNRNISAKINSDSH